MIHPLMLILYINFLTDGPDREYKIEDLYFKLLPPLYQRSDWYQEAQKFFMKYRVIPVKLQPIPQPTSIL